MRNVRVCFWNPTKDAEHCEMDLLQLISVESEIRYETHAAKGLPSREVLNRVFERGSSDEGWIPITWEPFAIDEKEYAELAVEYETARKMKR